MEQRSRVAPWASPRARARLTELESEVAGLGLEGVVRLVDAVLAEHRGRLDEDGVVLYAGTNTMSERARAAYEISLGGRPSTGWPGEKPQTGLDEVDVLEVLAPLQVAAVMGGAFAEVRLQSATLATLACYGAFTRPGDTVALLPESAGGHAGHHARGTAAIRGLRVADLPYDAGRFDVDHAALPAFLREHRPALVMIGAGLMLFPYDVARIRAACDAAGSLLLYDASQVAGLVAGGRFQQPLEEGAHLLTMSTYASFGGPPGGAVITREEDLAHRVSSVAHPGLTANYDASRLAPLAVTAAEHAAGGPDHADRCIANAAALAGALHREGFAVAAPGRGWTASHQVAVDVAAFGGGDEAARSLAEGGIYLGGATLPGQPPGEPARGLRLGTQEVTRRGFGPEAMGEVAALMRRLLVDGHPPVKILQEAMALRRAVS
ncbi:glycine hydroxymethyltransferase [Streptosporangium becharense]|uniref:Glycine hydroxymethyltransferase n=1 Tax=Streptosporangium becharense TaxID=1816182 RepID=A0A7W9IBX4_9ACTN|nr:glycine hydroxymethyltransferase [Streptosporangium becharense]MBB2913604.1 glycine hydroxymethyltransferase [Streptosporangium becharense]MBB5817685.1 glycine hydroxymethyltransferase [Streptosporangium becharense]